MDEFSSNSSQQHNTDIKQEIVDQIKNEFDSSSQDKIALPAETVETTIRDGRLI